MSNVVIFDLETIPDYSVWFGFEAPKDATPNDEAPKKRGRKPKAEPFAPCYAHRIVCLGFLTIQDGVPTAVDAHGATDDTSEGALLKGFSDFLHTTGATVVTWNGRNFDVPVIQLRSYRHGISQTWYGRDFRKRYDENGHIDLCDVMTEYGALGKTGYSLDVFAQLIGLPGKNGTDGTQVKGLFEAGRHEEIKSYCRRDVVQTAYVYLRFQLLRGSISMGEYKKAVAKLRTLWEGDAAFNGFKVDRKVLELG